MDVLDALEEAKAATWWSEDGDQIEVTFAPGLNEERLRQVEAELGAPLPEDYRQLAMVCGGVEGTLDLVEFGGIEGQHLEEVMPHALHFAADGYGNSWYIDCRSGGEDEARVFFACHDAPVILFQCLGMAAFLRELIRFYRPPHKSLIDDVHEDRLFDVWRKTPAALPRNYALSSADSVMRQFAGHLDEAFTLVDLRDVAPGMGFAWAKHGPQTRLERYGEERIFAYAPPVRKPNLLSRLFRSA